MCGADSGAATAAHTDTASINSRSTDRSDAAARPTVENAWLRVWPSSRVNQSLDARVSSPRSAVASVAD